MPSWSPINSDGSHTPSRGRSTCRPKHQSVRDFHSGSSAAPPRPARLPQDASVAGVVTTRRNTRQRRGSEGTAVIPPARSWELGRRANAWWLARPPHAAPVGAAGWQGQGSANEDARTGTSAHSERSGDCGLTGPCADLGHAASPDRCRLARRGHSKYQQRRSGRAPVVDRGTNARESKSHLVSRHARSTLGVLAVRRLTIP